MPSGRLQQEIQQSKPFDLIEVEVQLNLMRTHDFLHAHAQQFFRAHGISSTQYNALRILRGAGPDGLPSLEVGARMVARVPDITRLLDRLEEKGYVQRERSSEDRRVIVARISRKGTQLLGKLDEPVLELNKEMLGHMNRQDLEELSRLLELARCGLSKK